jgi:hypothetical protein
VVREDRIEHGRGQLVDQEEEDAYGQGANTMKHPLMEGKYAEMIRKGIRAGRVIRLLPRHDVYLNVWAGNGQRFAEVFRAAWKRIPIRVRRRILKHWKDGSMPRIELIQFQLSSPGAVAHVNLGGQVRFYSKYVEKMPDDVLQCVIAHELAHVLQRTQPRGYFPPSASEESRRELRELDACFLTDEWGFDPDLIDNWWRTLTAT